MLSAAAMALTMAAQGADGAITVKGTVADSLTKEGEPYAIVRISQQGDSAHALKMMLTDKGGRFATTVRGCGGMTVTVSSMGRRPVVRDFTVMAGQAVVDLDTLLISNADNELRQVVVTAQKPLVKADIDKLTYNIEDDPDSKSNTVIEMLRKVPMVTVDGEDNIKVNGSSTFKVYVNGKPNKMMSDNPTEVLRSLPANSVKRIEVITNPGPKYDAEGVGGILNIITAGSGPEGYTVTLRGDLRDTGAGGGLFGTVKKGRLTVSARYSYNHNDENPVDSRNTRRTVGEAGPASSDLVTDAYAKNRADSHSGSMEASYEIDTLRLVSAELDFWEYDSRGNSSRSTAALSPVTADELYRYRMDGRDRGSRTSVDGGLDYQRTFAGVKDRMLTLSYRISLNKRTSDSFCSYLDKVCAPDWQDFVGRMNDQRNDGRETTTEHTLQADYTTPIGRAHTVEAGAKYIIRCNTSENDRYERSAAGADLLPDAAHSSHYKHRNAIAAAYLGYGLKAGRWTARLGLRYEHTEQRVEYLLGRGDDFGKGFDDIVPSASLSCKLTETAGLRAGYNMRIYRPGIWFLNPYLDDSTPTYISQGNPDLTSEKSHSLNINFSSFTPKLGVNLSAAYSFTNNSIESVAQLVSDVTLADKGLQNPTGKDVIYSTYRNIGRTRALDLTAFVNWSATPSTRVDANIYGRYSHLEDGQSLRNHGWFTSVYGSIQQTLPKDWSVSAEVYYQTPWIGLQGHFNKWLSYGLRANKSFMDKRLTLSAYVRNLFKKYMNVDWNEQSGNFYSDNRSRRQLFSVGVSVSYRIGELKAGVRKAERTISNDDTKGGGGNGGN